jgi:hypothetical protein
VAFALFHLLALALVSRLAHWPYLLVLLILSTIILTFQLYNRLAPHTLRPTLHAQLATLHALLPLYIVAILRLIISTITRFTCPGCEPVPQPWASWLSYEWVAVFGLLTFIIWQSAITIPSSYRPRLATGSLFTFIIIWTLTLYPHLNPAGVSGADPFAYVQMAVDLATRGTPTHHFALADLARQLNIPIYPTLFVGYTIPFNGDSATVWPVGFSALLALAFKLVGEPALSLLNPILSLASAAATFLLARTAFKLSTFFSLLSAALLLTSLEQTIRLSVPLADIAVQLFTTLAISVAFTNFRFQILDSLFCGFLAALAFITRYTQLLLIPGLLFILISQRRQNPVRHTQYIFCISLFFISFAIVSFPDFLYRAVAFGSPLASGSTELSRFSLADIPSVTSQLLIELVTDFNFLLPLTLIGLAVFIRNNRLNGAGLALTLGPVILFHLPYHYLKLRDLLFILPTLCALAVYNLHLLYHLRPTPYALRLTLAFLLSGLLLFRFSQQLPFLSGYYTYGFLTAEGRSHINSIAGLTEPSSAIAASLNGGAISLYAQRDTFRPGHLLQPGRTWTDAELRLFVSTLHTQGRPVYVLVDSEEMVEPLTALATEWRLTPIAELYLPYYYRDGSATNELIPLYRLDPP